MSSENPNKSVVETDLPNASVVELPIEEQLFNNAPSAETAQGEIVGEVSAEEIDDSVVTNPEDIVPEPPSKSEDTKVEEAKQIDVLMSGFDSLYAENNATDNVGNTKNEVSNVAENAEDATNIEDVPETTPASEEVVVRTQEGNESVNEDQNHAEEVTEVLNNAEIVETTTEQTSEDINETNKETENTNVPENVNTENSNQENNESKETVENNVENVEDADYEVLNEENKGYLETGLSQKGKRFFGGLYEKLDRIPVFNKIAGKMAIAYNEKFAKVNEKATHEISGKIAESDQKLKQFTEIENQLKSVLESLKGDNLPGKEKILTSLRRIEAKRKKEETRNQENRGKLASKIENYKSFVNERNRIADGLIGFYEEKMAPVKEKMDELNKEKLRIKGVGSGQEIRSENHRQRISELESRKNKIVEVLKAAKMSDGEIARFPGVKSIDSMVKKINKEIEEDKNKTKKELDKNNKRIDSQNNKYRKIENKKKVFDKIKLGESVDFNDMEIKAAEEVIKGGEYVENNSVENSAESDRKSISEFMTLWNKYQESITDENEKLPQVDVKELLTAFEISQPQSFSADQFGKILKAFYEYKQVPSEKFDEKIKTFKQLITNTVK